MAEVAGRLPVRKYAKAFATFSGLPATTSVSPGHTLKSMPGAGFGSSPRTTATTVTPTKPWSAGLPSGLPAMSSS
jgi:hypothetical protein